VLYGYPVEATADNWLHDCLAAILSGVHAQLTSGEIVPEWPDFIPGQYRNRLISRTGLKNRLTTYLATISGLTEEERERILQAFNDENQIANLLSATSNCESINDLPLAVQEPVCDLFDYAFDLLAGLGIRDEFYRLIYNGIKYRVCPFCGLEFFDAPGAAREALDHFLAKSRYPFAAANLRNLVPMGQKCNSRYKLDDDILKRADGTRRQSFDPYGPVSEISISLSHSQPFAGKDGQVPAWNIQFHPVNDQVATWDAVFRIRDRYERDVLDPSFKSWLTEFSAWCRYAQLNLNGQEDLLDALKKYAEVHESFGLQDRSFLKAALFRMLLKHCSDGDERLSHLLIDLTS
jgi:hypothetical protein